LEGDIQGMVNHILSDPCTEAFRKAGLIPPSELLKKGVVEKWQTENKTIKIRVTSYEETGANVNGAYYQFESAAPVTTDGGARWSVWDATHDLPNWQCFNYRFIQDVTITEDGHGVMRLNPIENQRGEVPELRTNDYGTHWLTD